MKWDDGTTFNPPQDPLAEKWNKLYPPCRKGKTVWDYACMFCNKCPYGDNWKVPDEDKAVWTQYQADLMAYVDAHGGWEHLLLDISEGEYHET